MLALAGQDDTQAYNNTFGNAVAPGRYVALLWLYANANERYHGTVLARVPLDLKAGSNPVTLRVPELHTLKLRVPGADRGSKVDFRSARRPGRNGFEPEVTCGEGGVASIGELPAGLYTATVTVAGEQREMIVRVPAPGEVTFEPSSLAGLAVTVEDASGLLATSGFQSGDVIVSMDGTVIDSTLRAANLLYAAHGRAGIPVEVLRGGRRIALTIDPAKFGLTGSYGGWWEPVPR
jgi:membrane-associated protease RseP (regulator of RpoE activity)